MTFADGTKEKIWCTFGEEQIDLDVNSPHVKKFFEETVRFMCEHGAGAIRLDAFAYAVKKADTSCFFVEPEMWELLYEIERVTKEYGVDILPEIHEHYSIQMKIAEKGFWVYDFALPMLVLHALYTHRGDRLKHWLDICPRKQMTTLDTHDGIGVVDVVDLLSPEEIEETKELLYSKSTAVRSTIIWIFTRLTAAIILRWETTTMLICWHGQSSSLLRAFRRFIMWGCSQVRMIWSF